MKITIHSTTKIVTLKPGPLSDGVQARVWEGETETGIKVHCFVTRIACALHTDTTQFQNELQECSAPTPEIETIPTRLVL
jgi:hypothetical protein